MDTKSSNFAALMCFMGIATIWVGIVLLVEVAWMAMTWTFSPIFIPIAAASAALTISTLMLDGYAAKKEKLNNEGLKNQI